MRLDHALSSQRHADNKLYVYIAIIVFQKFLMRMHNTQWLKLPSLQNTMIKSLHYSMAEHTDDKTNIDIVATETNETHNANCRDADTTKHSKLRLSRLQRGQRVRLYQVDTHQ